MVRKSNIRTYTPPEQIKVEPNIAIVKDLLSDNIDARSQSSELRLILSNKSHLNSIVFIIKEPAQEVSSMVRLLSESRAYKF